MNKDLQPFSIAWFITPHGFGHAARACAIMLELASRISVRFELYTRVPGWFFDESHLHNYIYHDCLADIGLAQHSSMEEDLDETLHRLDAFLPFDPAQVSRLAEEVKSAGCRLVVCDISPLGIAVAEAAGLPSLLVENFTWDWIYTGYLKTARQFDKYIPILAKWFARATAHMQTEPVCASSAGAVQIRPVSRPLRQARQEMRARLGLDATRPAVLLTMGGIETQFSALEDLRRIDGITWIIPGGSPKPVRQGAALLLPHHSGLYHPDLVNACEAVVGKLGYSTLAETYNAGVPFGFIPRPAFRESGPLGKYAREQMRAIEIPQDAFENGAWLNLLPQLLAAPAQKIFTPNGACQAAEWIITFLRDRPGY